MAHAVVSDLEGIGVCISGAGNPVPLCVQLVKLTIPVKTIPHVSVSHPFIERLIGTIRREYLDHVLFWNESDLERKLDVFKEYYNGSGIHQSLNQQTPEEVAGKAPPPLADPRHFVWQSHCQGLFQTPMAA